MGNEKACGGDWGGAANQPGAWEPHWERMLRWARSALPRDQEVLVLADQGLKGGGFAGRLSTVSVPPNARADPSVS